ncbi:MAG: phenylacetate--CoA ligase family protein [Bacteroidetes bacterium]|nr:MAG: phenylacetate--CoA ligase family protein [Bacteroidota bacterium]
MQAPAIEFASADDIRARQQQLLAAHLQYVYAHSPYYRSRFQQAGIEPQKIRGLEDLPLLPTTSKNDLQQHNQAFMCVERAEIVDYVTTSGTLGDPVSIALTEKDLQRLAYNEAISFLCAGAGPGDVFQLMTTMDRRFMAGLAYFMGVRKLGGSIIRVGSGVPGLQWDSIFRFSPDVLITVPSFLLHILHYASKHGIDWRSSSVRKAVCIGEPIRKPDFSLNALGQKIRELWELELYSTYASTEMATAFTECAAGRGGHLHPELIIVELLDEHDQPVPAGEAGEVTVTPLGVEGMPLLRFKTGDIAQLHTGSCSCGRNNPRLGPVVGRKQHLIKYKGTSLYPPAIYEVLNRIEGVEKYVVELSSNPSGMDEITVHIGCGQAGKTLATSIMEQFQARLRVKPKLKFHSTEEVSRMMFPAMSRKPVKLIDRRNL